MDIKPCRTPERNYVAKDDFDDACLAVLTEIEYQDALPRRTGDEAKDVASFATLIRKYLRDMEEHWASQPALPQPEGVMAVPDCLHDMRKLAAICMRGMVYCGIRARRPVFKHPT